MSMKISQLNINREEFDAIVNELAERVKDVVSMTAKHQAAFALRDIMEGPFEMDNKYTVTFPIEFSGGAILQILGRLRQP